MNSKFTTAEIAKFRDELLSLCRDRFDSAEVIKAFVTGHGFGISPETALGTASRIDRPSCDLQRLHSELEAVALMM
jgi:hypothetical protein